MRHERAFLVALAYVIGFTTAFIAFGVSSDTITDQISYTGSQNVAAVAATMTAVPEPIITTQDVGLDERGLYVMRDGEEYFVSARLPQGSEPGAGYHVSIDRLTLTNDGRLLYYCAQEDFDQEGCTEYVYDVLDHSVSEY